MCSSATQPDQRGHGLAAVVSRVGQYEQQCALDLVCFEARYVVSTVRGKTLQFYPGLQGGRVEDVQR